MIATHAATVVRSDLPGRALRLAAILVAVVLVAVGLDLIRDPLGPDRLFAAVYGLLGQDATAAAILERGLHPLQAKLTVMAIALVIGVGGVWLLYTGLDGAVDLLPGGWRERIRPYVFLGPAMAMLAVFLVIPVVVTILASLTEDGGAVANWGAVLTSPEMWLAFRNNVIWLVLGTGGSVAIGLLVATLVDRVKREALAKTFIFLPLAISMVGASVIWKFVYAWAPEGEQQIGILNEVWTWFGNEPVPWLQIPPLNTVALIVIMVWLQTGFAMVVLSAALKVVPNEVIEAARAAFPAPPDEFPRHLDIQVKAADEGDDEDEPNQALASLKDAARTTGTWISDTAGTVGGGVTTGAVAVGAGVATAAGTVSRPFRRVDIDGDGVPDEPAALTAVKGVGGSIAGAADAVGGRVTGLFRSKKRE